MYERKSSGDIGTIFAAKNFLNASNAPDSPMDNPDEMYDFIEKYTSALILCCFEKVKSRFPNLPTPLEIEQQDVSDEIVEAIVSEFCIPQMPEFDGSSEMSCHVCQRPYKSVNGLRKHFMEKHFGDNTIGVGNSDTMKEFFPCSVCKKFYKREANCVKHMLKEHGISKDEVEMHAGAEESRSTTKEDGVFNYSCNALALGLLAMCFTDARRHGDGERIMLLYPFMMLIFKLAGNTKYAHYSLYTIAQVKFLLPPHIAEQVIWERFVNTKGRMDSNVEVDRYLEHRNKVVKLNCRDLLGKITEKSLDRASKSYEAIEEIVKLHDIETLVKRPSGKHKRKHADDDIKELAKQFCDKKILEVVPGRHHKAFPAFKRNILHDLDVLALKEWVQKTVTKFKKLNIYQKINDQ